MTKRSMYNTAEGQNLNIALGEKDYGVNKSAGFKLPAGFIPIPSQAYTGERDAIMPLGQYGIGESRYDEGLTSQSRTHLQNIRASRQGPIAQFGNMLNQMVVGEVLGGTIEGIGYLGALGEFNGLMAGEDEEFGNEVSRAGKRLREWTKEETPIYEYDYREGDFRPWDWSWWMTNAPSIASTVSLMIPAAGVASIPGKIAKALGASDKMVRGIFGVSQAITSRYMENMMEAAGTYDEAKQIALASNPDMSDKQASMYAAKAAKNTYNADWAMLAQDLPQYLFLNGALAKAFGKKAPDISTKGKKFLGMETTLLDTRGYTIGKDMIGEGLEEGYQYMANEFGKYTMEKQLNPDMDYGFFPYAKEHTKNGELFTSMFMGALGASAMHSLDMVNDKIRGKEDYDILEAKNAISKYSAFAKDIMKASINGDAHQLNISRKNLGSALAARAARTDRVDLMNQMLDMVSSGEFATKVKDVSDLITPEELEVLKGDNGKAVKEFMNQTIQKYTDAMKDINTPGSTLNLGAKKAYKDLSTQGSKLYKNIPEGEFHKIFASTVAEMQASKEAIDTEIESVVKESDALYDKIIKSTLLATSKLSNNGKRKLNQSIAKQSLESIIDEYNKVYPNLDDPNIPENTRDDVRNTLSDLNKELSEIDKDLKEIEDNYDSDELKKDKKIKINIKDWDSYNKAKRVLYELKRDSYSLDTTLKRLAKGHLISKGDLEKASKQYKERVLNHVKENGFDVDDRVVTYDNQKGIITRVTNDEDGIPTYTVSIGTYDDNGKFIESGEQLDYSIDDLNYDKPEEEDLVPEEFETVSSDDSGKNVDREYEIRLKLKKDLSHPLSTLCDIVSTSHIDDNNLYNVIVRDEELDELLSTPSSEVDRSLAKGSVEYEIDLDNDWWNTSVTTKSIKEKIISVQSGKFSNKEKEEVIKIILKYFDNLKDKSHFNNAIDTIPIKMSITVNNKVYKGTDKYKLFLHNSDYYNLAAPVDEIDPAGYEEQERLNTRALRRTIVNNILVNGKVHGSGLKRINPKLNRIVTYGPVDGRLGIDLKDVELCVTLDEGQSYYDNERFIYSGLKPGTVSVSTNKTVSGETRLIPLNISNLSIKHADIVFESLYKKYLVAPNAVLERDDVKGLTVGETLDLLVTSGRKTSLKMLDKSQMLYIEPSTQTLHYGNNVIEDIFNPDTKQKNKEIFIKWAIANKKYNIRLKDKVTGYSLNKPYKKTNGFTIDTIVVPADDTRTWAQVLVSTVIGKNNKRILSTNVDRVEGKDGKIECIEHSPVLKINNSINNGEVQVSEEEKPTPPVEPIPETKEKLKREGKPTNPLKDGKIKNIGKGKIIGFEKTSINKEYKDKVTDSEIKWFNERIGNKTLKQTDTIIRLADGGREAYGAFTSNCTYIYSDAPMGTTYHEAFHRVSLGYLTSTEREKYYKNARTKYGMPKATDSEIEEKLAEEFRAWKLNKTENKPLPKKSISDWIKELYDFIVYFFTGKNKLTSYEVESLFKLIDSGRFKNRYISPVNRFKLSRKEVPYPVSSFETGMFDVPFVKSREEFMNFIKGLGVILLEENEISSLNDVRSIKFSKLFNYINEELVPNFKNIVDELQYYIDYGEYAEDETKESLETDLVTAKNLVDLYDSINTKEYREVYMRHLRMLLRSQFNIRANETRPDEDEETDYEVESAGEQLLRYDKESFEVDIRNNVSANIKFLIATLSKSEDINPSTRTRDYVNFNDVWYKLLFDLHDLNNIDEMMDKINQLGEIYYPYKELHSKLSAASSNIRAQFKVTLQKHKHQFINFLYSINPRTGVAEYKISTADIARAERVEARSWAMTFLESDLIYRDEETGIQQVNDGVFSTIYDDYLELKKDIQKNFRNKLTPEVLTDYKKRVLYLLNSLQINIDERTLDKYLENQTKYHKGYELQNALGNIITDEKELGIVFTRLKELSDESAEAAKTLNTAIKAGKKIRTGTLAYDLNSKVFSIFESKEIKIGDTKVSTKSAYIVRELARCKFQVYPDLLDDVILGPEGHMYFSYANNSYATSKLKQYRDKNYIDSVLSKEYHKGSYILNIIKDNEELRNSLNIKTMSALQETDARDSGTAYKDLNNVEDYILRMSAIHNGLMPFPVLSDRSTYYFLEGVALPTNIYNISEDGQLVISDDIINIFYKYAEAERDRIEAAKVLKKAYIDAKDDTEKQKIMDESMVLNYHYNLKGTNKDFNANAYKYVEFASFNRKDFNFERDAKNDIRNMLTGIIQEGIKTAIKYKLIEQVYSKDFNETVYTNKILDRDLIGKFLNTSFNRDTHAIQNIIAATEIGQAIANFETSMMFTGDPAFYKSNKKQSVQEDRIKRLGAMTSSGDIIDQQLPDKGITRTHYSIATLSTQKFDISNTEYYKSIRAKIIKDYVLTFVKSLQRNNDPKFEIYSKYLDPEVLAKANPTTLNDTILKPELDINVNKFLEAYTKIDPTDGQAYVTPEMYREILMRLGEWSDAKKNAYNLLMTKSFADMSFEEYNSSIRLMMQPLKPVLFDVIPANNILVPTYNKMSIACLFPELVKGTQIEDLANRMSAKTEKYKDYKPVDMVIYDSAVKTGIRSQTPLFANETRTVGSDLTKMFTYEQPFYALRRQTITDPHNVKETKLGTQFAKISLGDLRLDEMIYQLPGTEQYISGKEIANIVFNSLASISDRGLNKLKKELGYDSTNGTVDLKILVNKLRNDAIRGNKPELVIDALRMENERLWLELDAHRTKVSSRLIGMTNKASLDIEMPGNQFIQVSETGLHVSSDDRLKWYTLTEDGKLKSAECAISISMFKHIIPNYKNLTYKQACDYVLKNTPELLAYRIPTQSQASVIYLKVTKLLPENTGDTIVFPEPVTALTGSDFDIDKMFAVRYSYTTNEEGDMIPIKFSNTLDEAFKHQYNETIDFAMKRIATLKQMYLTGASTEEKYNDIVEAINIIKEITPESLLTSIESNLDYLKENALLNADMLWYTETQEKIDILSDIENAIIEWAKGDIVELKDQKEAFMAKFNNETDPYVFNSTSAIKNRLLDAYLSVYRSSAHISQSQLPNGAYTEQLKEYAENVLDRESTNDLFIYSATNQNRLKFEYTGGKDGVAPFALNNVHHILAQIAGLKYSVKDRTGTVTYSTNQTDSYGLLNENEEGSIDLSQISGKDGLSILGWLSAMIDSHVDLAKDNYIMRLNVNKNTYNFVALMLRGGCGLKTFKILTQPILKEYAFMANNTERDNKLALYRTKWYVMDELRARYTSFLTPEGVMEKDKVLDRGFSNNIVKELTADDLLQKNLKFNIDDIQSELDSIDPNLSTEETTAKQNEIKNKYRNQIIHQLQMLNLFEYFDKIGKDLNTLVQLSKIDTKKYGSSITEVINFDKRIKDFMASNKFINEGKLFPTDKIVNGESLIGPYYRNSVKFLMEIMPKLTIYATDGFKDIVSAILDISGNSTTLDGKLLNTIADEVFASMCGEFFFDPALQNGFGYSDSNLIYNLQNVPKMLSIIKYSDKPLSKLLSENTIIKLFNTLNVDTSLEMPFNSYLAVARKSFKDKLNNDDYMYAILDLLTFHGDPKNPEEVALAESVHNFAVQLFMYSFATSGFRNKLNSFFNILPPIMFKELKLKDGSIVSFNEYIYNKKAELADKLATPSLSKYIDEVFKNNWYNKRIVPSINNNDSTLELSIVKKNGEYTDKLAQLTKVFIGNPHDLEKRTKTSSLFLGVNRAGIPVFKKFATRYQSLDNILYPHFMQFIGVIQKQYTSDDGKHTGTLTYPVYKTIPRKSSERGVVTVKEYFINESIITSNNEGGEYIRDGEEYEYFENNLVMSAINSNDALKGGEFLYLDDIYPTTANPYDTVVKDIILDYTEGEPTDNNKQDTTIPTTYTQGNLFNTTSNKNTYTWSRKSDNSYEVTTKGDKRFSAFNATLKSHNNRSIEDIYQTDIKGYSTREEGKGKPPLNNMSQEESWNKYKALWVEWANENPDLIQELGNNAYGRVLTDMFSTTEINQAHALSDILNETNIILTRPTPTVRQWADLNKKYGTMPEQTREIVSQMTDEELRHELNCL